MVPVFGVRSEAESSFMTHPLYDAQESFNQNLLEDIQSYFSNFQIYFRRDVDSTSSMNGVDKQVGSSWVEMVGAFSFVDVGPNDQVRQCRPFASILNVI